MNDYPGENNDRNIFKLNRQAVPAEQYTYKNNKAK